MLTRASWAGVRDGLCVCAAMAVALVLPGPARAAFGVERFEASVAEQGGAPDTQAGSHPYAATFTLEVNHHEPSLAQRERVFTGEIPDGESKDVELTLPAGLIVNLLGTARCTEVELAHENARSPARSGW